MRTKLFRFLIMAFLVVTTATSCFDGLSADVSESDVRKGRKFTTAMCAAPMQNEFETKSLLGSRSDAAVYNWNLFVFDGGVLVGKYYKSSGEDIEFDVKLDHFYEFMAVANVGNKTNLFGAGATKTEVAALELTDVSSGYSANGLPMYWASSSPIKFTKAQYDSHTASLDIQMIRLTGKYQIAVNKHGLNKWSFRVKSLVMKGASSIRPFSSSANAATSYSTVSDQATAADITLLQTFDNMDVSSPAVFYPLENVMDTPSSLSGNSDPWNKVQDRVPGNKYPTYVEMVAEATLQDGSGISKDVTYRFYLGYNATNDFRVVRNVSHSLMFYPDDESITNGHMGNWKITPGPFDDTRDLDFARQTTADTRYRVRAGTNDVESIVKVPSALKYVVKKSTDNITVKNTSTSAVIANNTVTDASSLTLDIAPGVKQTAEVTIETIDGALSDVLHLDIFNAYLEITDPVPAVRNWGWNTYGTLSAQTFTVRTSVDFTMTAPSGWSASKSLVSETAGEKVWTITVYPESPCTVETAPGESLSLVFRNSEIDDVTATLTRDFKPMVSVDKNNLTWIASKAGENDGINVSVTSNESWTVTKGGGWDDNKWGISTTSGSGNGTIKVWPKTVNATIPPVDVTTLFTIMPNRGTDAEKVTVNMTHQKPAVNLDITEDGNSWPWKSTDAFTFHVTGNVNWQASLSNTEKWEFVGASTGSGNGTVTVRPKAQNLSITDLVSGTLSLACTDVGITVTPAPTASLQQGVHPNIALSSSDNLQWAWNATDAKGITLTLSPEGYGWQAQLVNGEASHWQMAENHTNNTISIQPTGVNDDVNNTLSVQVRITATDPDDTQSSAVVTCTHNKREPYFYFVDPTQQNLSWRWYENASNTVTVSFSTSESWSHAVTNGNFTATKDGNSLVIAPAGANSDAAARTARVNITVAGHPELNTYIDLSQEAKPTVSVSPANKAWAWNATTAQSFTVTCTPGYTWTASKTSDSGNKFSLSNASGASGSAFNAAPVGVNDNTSAGNVATIIVTLVNAGDPHAGEVSASVNLTQDKKEEFYITPSSQDWGWQGGMFQFTVVDNQGLSWTPEVVGADASVFTAVRSGSNVNVTVSQASATDISLRTATLQIKVGSEVKASASLSREAHPYLSITALDGTSWAYNETGAKRYSVSTVGVSAWTPTVDNENFTVSVSGDIVTITPMSQNSGTSPRNVRLTVSSNNYAVDGSSDFDDLTQGVNGAAVTGSTLQVQKGSSWVTSSTFTVGENQAYRIAVSHVSDPMSYVTSGFELTSGNAGVVSVNGNKISTSAVGAGTATVSTTYEGYPTSVSITVNDKIEYRNLSISLNPDVIDDVNNLSSTATAVADRYVNDVLDQAGVDVTSSTSFQVLEDNPPVTQSGNVFTWNNSGGDDTDITIRGTFSGMTADAMLTVKEEYEAPYRYFIDVTGFKIYDSSEIEASDVTVNYGDSESYSVKAVVDVFYGQYRNSATYVGTEEVDVSASNVSWNWTGDSEYANGRTVSNTNQSGTNKYVTFSSINAAKSFYVYSHSAYEPYYKNQPLPTSNPFTVTLPSEDVTPTYKVVTSANPDELQVGEFTSLSATLYSSTDGGLNWTVVSSSPDGFVKASGDAVINTSTGKAVATGTGTYYGQFNGYTIDVYENASVTVTPATIYKVVTSATRTELNVNDLQTKITELSAVLYSSTDGGVNWTLEPNSPDRFEFVPGSGVDILILSSNIGVASTYGKGTYHGVFDGYSVDTYEGVVITAHETHYDNLVVEFEREWFAAGTSITVAAYVDEYTDGKKTTSRIDVTSDAQFASVSGNISVSGSTVTSTGSYYGVATVSGTYGSLVSYADINIQSLVALSFGETDIYFGSLGTKTVSINGVWSNYPNSGSVEIPITTYFPYQIRFFDYGTDLDGRVTWSNTGRNSEKYTSNPTLTISRPSSYHSSYVKTSPGRYELPVNLYVAEFPHLSYELTPYIELIETELNYSPKETQTNTTSINVEFSAVLGLDGSGEAWNTYSGHAVEVAYTWGTKWPSINNERWTISHPANSNSLYIQFKGFVGDEDSASQVFTIGQQPNAHQFVVTADRAGSTYTNMSVAPN